MNRATDQLDRYRTAEFSLEELASTSGRLLRRMAVRPADGRVAGAPDERGIRFYQTAGVVDRPLRYDGRRAVYGFRHLVQLLAVKRLQQEGQPLALIQRALAGLQTRELETALERLPIDKRKGEAETSPVAAGGALEATPPDAARPHLSPGGGRTSLPAHSRQLMAVELAPGITLTIDPARVHDAEAVIARVTDGLREARESGQ